VKLTLEAAERIAKKVNEKLSSWDVPVSIRPGVVIMISLVVRELRAEAKSQQNTDD